MQKVNEFKFYELASVVHPLTTVSEIHYNAIMWAWWDARAQLDQIFAERPLTVAMQSALRLYNALAAVVPRDFTKALEGMTAPDDLAQNPDADLVPEFQTYEIKEAAKLFETVLAAEVNVLDTYLVSQKGAYKTSDLIERAEIVFTETTRVSLPAITITDIQQAGRCIALDTPTAAGFHLMRAIEGVMAIYYNRVLGKPMPTRMRNWGTYIKKLRDSGKAEEKVIGFLDHIRDNYRNPILHPDVILTGDEAETLLSLATGSIRQMVLEIQRMDAETMAAVAVAPTAPPVLQIRPVPTVNEITGVPNEPEEEQPSRVAD